MMREPRRFLSARELAARLGVSRRTVSRLVSAGILPQPIRFSRRLIRWDWSAVEAAIADRGRRPRKNWPGKREALMDSN